MISRLFSPLVIARLRTHAVPSVSTALSLLLGVWLMVLPINPAWARALSPASLCWPQPIAGETEGSYGDTGGATCPSFNWVPVNVNNDAVRDYEKEGSYSDPSSGVGGVGAENDVSSGFLNDIDPDPARCNPADNVYTGGNCGDQPSGYWSCALVPDDGVAVPCTAPGSPAGCRVRLYFRTRVNGDPSNNGVVPQIPGDNKVDFTSGHWNYLISTRDDIADYGESEDWKEFWIDVDGSFNSNNPDRLRIIFEDDQTTGNSVNNTDGANCTASGCGQPLPPPPYYDPDPDNDPDTPPPPPPGNGTGTVVNAFVACKLQGLNLCQDGTSRELSHTRVIPLEDPDTGNPRLTDGLPNGDDPGEFWIDVQVPLTEYDAVDMRDKFVLTRNESASYAPLAKGSWPGPDMLVYYGQPVITGCTLLPTDPDDVAGPTGPGTQPGVRFAYATSDSGPNPVQKDYMAIPIESAFTFASVTYFRAARTGAGMRFEWQTGAELANLGFDIYEHSGRGWRKVNPALIPGAIDSVLPQDYSYEGPASEATRFMLVDVDVNMKVQRHGPYEIDAEYGARLDPEPINWAAIESEHNNKKTARAEKRRDALMKHLGQDDNNGSLTTLSASRASSAASAAVQPLLDLGVEQDGIHRVTYAQLAAAGVDLNGVPGGEIALTYRGAPVPIRVVTGRKDVFRNNSYIEFVGKAPRSLYTETNVYQLHRDATLALRVVEDNTKPPKKIAPEPDYTETVTVDKNVAHAFTSPNVDDPWYETTLIAWGAPTSRDFQIELDNVVSGGAATLHLNVWGAGNFAFYPDHHLVVEFNGTKVADERFDGSVDVPLTINLPAGLVREGSNTLTLRLPFDTGDPDVFLEQTRVNSYAVSYQRSFVARSGALAFTASGNAFEIGNLGSSDAVAYRTDGTTTTLLANTSTRGGTATLPGSNQLMQYYVSSASSIPSPTLSPSLVIEDISSGDAAYLVIGHPDFLSGPPRVDLDRLVDTRAAEYGSAKVVDVEQIYAQITGGNTDPDAIRQYIQYAVSNLGTQAVLLVGGDTYDYLNYTGLNSISFIPSLYADAGYGFKHTPSDTLYVDTDGDYLPDADIGRLPVRDDAELTTLVDKTFAFAAAGNRKAVFAADDSDDASNFTEISDAIAAKMPAAWESQRIYLDTYLLDPDGNGAQRAHDDLIDAINLGNAALVSYVGHSSPSNWTSNSPRLLTNTETGALTNTLAPSVVAQWGCWMDYINPHYNTLTHGLLLNPNGGAAAVFGMAGANSSTSDAELGPLAQEAMMQSGATLGGAFTSAKHQLGANVWPVLDVILGGTLLGDPGLKVNP